MRTRAAASVAARATAAATAAAAAARPMMTTMGSMRTLNAGAELTSSGQVSCVLPPSGLAHHLVRWPRRRVLGASPSAGPIGRLVSSPERACEWITAIQKGGRWGSVDCPWKMSLDGSAPNEAAFEPNEAAQYNDCTGTGYRYFPYNTGTVQYRYTEGMRRAVQSWVKYRTVPVSRAVFVASIHISRPCAAAASCTNSWCSSE